MTTTVTIHAHCNADTEVVIKTVGDLRREKDVVIQDGESHSCYVYDDRTVTVCEVKKST